MSKHDNDFWDGISDTNDKGKRKNKRKKRRPVWGVILLFLLLAFAVTGIYGFSMANRLLGQIFITSRNDPAAGQGKANDGTERAGLNILLIGSDQRDKEAARADTIIVAFLDKKDATVKLLSIPRDTRVKVPGHGNTKINAAHAYGGPALLMQTAEDFLGIPIDNYVEVNFEGFANIIDILGGVQMNVETRMYYPQEGINLYPGDQKLNGSDALAYVRWRGDPTADIGRIGRQQKFLTVLADKALNISTVFKLPKLVDQVAQYARTDLSPGDLLSLARVMSKMDAAAMETATVPGGPRWIDGISYWQADRQKTKAIVDNFLAEQPAEEAKVSDSQGAHTGN